MYATVDKNGKYTGTVYQELTKNVIDYHEQNGFKWIEINHTLQNTGTDESPDYGSVTQEELTAIEAQKLLDEQEKARDDAMFAGLPYQLDGIEYRVSFTSTDGNGMLQVEKVMLAGLSTVIRFENGTRMPMSPENFDAFASWFLVERNSFFI